MKRVAVIGLAVFMLLSITVNAADDTPNIEGDTTHTEENTLATTQEGTSEEPNMAGRINTDGGVQVPPTLTVNQPTQPAEAANTPQKQTRKAEVVRWTDWHDNSWAFVNLTIVVAGAALCMVALVEWIRTRGKKTHTSIYMVITAVCFIATSGLFITTENLKLSMVLVDEFTIVYMIFILVEMVTVVNMLFKDSDEKKELHWMEDDEK